MRLFCYVSASPEFLAVASQRLEKSACLLRIVQAGKLERLSGAGIDEGASADWAARIVVGWQRCRILGCFPGRK